MIVNPAVVGVPWPRAYAAIPPTCVTIHSAGAEASVVEKFTVAIVPVVAVPPTMETSPRALVLVYPDACVTDVTPDPTV